MKKIFTNGCFDILHRGHLELFMYARSLGDVLYVGVDSDEKVKIDKGPTRPINCLTDRMMMLSSIKYIDTVCPFTSREGLVELVRDIQPDIMVVGSDWKGKPIVGSEYAKEVRFFERIDGYSTTKTIQGASSGRLLH
jgi:D-beta-D-heptose 7-phosphate kinase/D-beta-D-heptose 1-phosphate adenosyltransferase